MFETFFLNTFFTTLKVLCLSILPFFGGNPGKEAIRRLASYLTGGAAGIGFEKARNHDKEHIRRETDRQMLQKKGAGMGWTDMDHYNEDRAKTRSQVVQNDTIILRLETNAKQVYENIKNSFTGSES